MTDRYSGYKIGQTAWFIVSVYLGLVLGDLAKEGLFKAIAAPDGDSRTLWIIVPTLTFYLLSVVEAYVWLNPPEDEQISGQDAVFRFVHLAIFLTAILFAAFLTYACTSSSLADSERYFVWSRSFGGIVMLFSLYNAVWIVKRFFFDANNCPTYRQILTYISFYLVSALVFFFSERILFFLELRRPEIALCCLYGIYIIVYFIIWWRPWHSKAFLYTTHDLYGVGDR